MRERGVSVKTRGNRQFAVPATILRVLSAVYHFPHAFPHASLKQATRVHAAIYYSLLDSALGFVHLPVNNAPCPTERFISDNPRAIEHSLCLLTNLFIN